MIPTMTTLYVVVVNDRHSDPTPFVFTEPERAIEEARQLFEERFDPEDAADDELGEQDPGDDWLYYAKWSHEGDDDVWVIERKLDAPIDA